MASDISQANLNLTPEEKRVYGQLFQQADSDGVGVVTGDVAVKFFEKTKLDPTVLGEIWQIGDKENRGFLTPAGFSIVLRLIGHCQSGRTATQELSLQPGPLPRFDGLNLAGPPQPAPLAQQPSGGPIRVPPLSPEKNVEYAALFDQAGARGGVLGGDAAKQVFERSRLPNEVLGQIWNLSDRDAHGVLNVNEFVVAMHLLTSMRTGAMRALPQTLPPGLYEAAARRPLAASPVNRQFSGPQRTQSPLAASLGAQTLPPQIPGGDWLISPQDKANFDRAFASIDTQGRGFITGDQAVPFFSNSGLGEEALAQIWDLADINSEGQLNRDEFAVAMYLIRQQRGKTADRGALPSALPAALIPPSMRQRVAPPAHSTAPNFDSAPPPAPQQKSAADDLFGLDALSTEPPAAQAPAVRADPFTSERPTSPASPKAAPAIQPRSTGGPMSFKPFVPRSNFGQGLQPQTTGMSVQSDTSSKAAAPAVPAADDLLGDTDPEVSKKFTAETTELANMSNQIGTLKTQMQEVQNKKTTTERDFATTSNQKKDLEQRLAQFRTQYEEEVRAVKSLESRLATARAETTKLSQDLAMIGGTHEDLKSQHQQLQTAFESDQRENAELKEKIRTLNAEVAELRPVIEKLKSDARQQKGMAAINKKQLATNEGEKDRLVAEKAELEKSIGEQAAAEAAQPPQAREAPAFDAPSPAASVTSQSTNPFFRKSPQQSVDHFMSPSVFRQDGPAPSGQSAFDSYFSTREAAPSAGPAPPTSFGAAAEQPNASVSGETSGTATPSGPPEPAPTSGFHTPPRSERVTSFETPAVADPPPPPQSRQITSSALPIQGSHLRSASPTSSVKANPPASRSGFSDFGATATPTAGSASGDAAETMRTVGAQNAAARLQPSSIPGAFPGDLESPVRPTAPENGFARDHAEEPQAGPAAFESGDAQEASKSDFDSAFASMNGETSRETHAGAVNGIPQTTNAAGEFPPIRDIEPDESDSESESGFRDSFAAPAGASAATTAQTATEEGQHEPKEAAAPVAAPPAANMQSSPPPYDATKDQGPEQFPREYTGLLPSREASMASPEAEPSLSQQASSASQRNASGSPLDSTSHPVSAELHAPVPARPAAPADDFDAAFDDLDEANEADGPGHESFSFAPASRADDEFNPTFDSPAPSKAGTLSDSIQHTPSTSTGRAFEQHGTSPFASSSSTAAAAGKSAAQPASGSSHDWDAIFASLDQPPNGAGAAEQSASGASPFALSPFGGSGSGSGSGAAGGLAAPRPAAPARAISAGTEHDDPILKSLTGMGYPRAAALSALEKFDYNLDKAADFLTSSK